MVKFAEPPFFSVKDWVLLIISVLLKVAEPLPDTVIVSVYVSSGIASNSTLMLVFSEIPLIIYWLLEISDFLSTLLTSRLFTLYQLSGVKLIFASVPSFRVNDEELFLIAVLS